MTPAQLPTTLVIGPHPAAREAAIVDAIAIAMASSPQSRTAVILEGMPDGVDRLMPTEDLTVARIAPGCPCCIGNLTMRVTLNRVLRHPPARLYIALATAAHLDQIRQFLTQPPYDGLLAMACDIAVVET